MVFDTDVMLKRKINKFQHYFKSDPSFLFLAGTKI